MATVATATVDLSDLLDDAGAQAGLRLLLEAARAGEESEADAWQFALRLPQLHQSGLTPTTLRLLVRDHLLEQRVETTKNNAPQRTFRPVRHLGLDDSCAVLLTPAGATFVRTFLGNPSAREAGDDPVVQVAGMRPHWNARTCVLWWGNLVVRRVRRDAENLCKLLAALEEMKWPPEGIDNPLSPTSEDERQRLGKTVEYLNRHQREARIEFRLDSSGTRVLWRVLEGENASGNARTAGRRSRRQK